MKILIIGGGIAGLSCALRLLRQGCRVVVAEKRKGPLDKVCGEGLLPFGAKLLDELGLLPAALAAGQRLSGVTYGFGDARVAGRFRADACGVGLERPQFDALLRNACALFPGFELREGLRVAPGAEAGFDRALAADGICSRWGEAHAGKVRRSDRLGVRFRLTAPAGDRVRVHFFEGFEVYLTPVGPEALSVAFLIDPERAPAPRGGGLKPWCLSVFRARFPEFADAPVRDLAARGPIAARRRGPAPSIHLLGDAWRAFDPISGAGMSFALLCAKLAAEHIHDPHAYYRALRPAMRAIDRVTDTVLFFRGGGWRTRLMLRQLSKAPEAFGHILDLHDGHSGLKDVDPRRLWAVLRP